jgi:hypothetical protein
MYKIIKSEEKRRQKLNYISLLKFWSMILIIKWHLFHWKKRKIDYGARMCEILFISSGFLVGYNYYKRDMPETFTNSFKYTYKHFRTFYPLEIINLAVILYFHKQKLNHKEIENLIFLNILLLKNWSRYNDLYKVFNPMNWFWMNLLFCYFFTPFLLGGTKKIKNSLIIFALIALIRTKIELYYRKSRDSINILDINFHTGPGIRFMEFFLGMLMIPTFFKIKEFIDKINKIFIVKIVFTIIQLLLPIYIYYLMVKYNNILFRCHFILIFCGFIFIFGFDYGYLSNIISMKLFQTIMSCQMEMYQIQITLNNLMRKFGLYNHLKFSSDLELQFIMKVIVIFIFAFIYKKMFKEIFSKILDKIILIIRYIFK